MAIYAKQSKVKTSIIFATTRRRDDDTHCQLYTLLSCRVVSCRVPSYRVVECNGEVSRIFLGGESERKKHDGDLLSTSRRTREKAARVRSRAKKDGSNGEYRQCRAGARVLGTGT